VGKVRNSCSVSVNNTDHVDGGILEVILIKKIDMQNYHHFGSSELFIINLDYMTSLVDMKLGPNSDISFCFIRVREKYAIEYNFVKPFGSFQIIFRVNLDVSELVTRCVEKSTVYIIDEENFI
jgi:hypothetical protein